jgi:chromosome partitioning protein
MIPIQAEFFALQGMGKLTEVVKLVESRLNPALVISGIVICMYRSRTTLAKEVIGEVESYFGEIVFRTRIRQNIKLAEAPGHGKTIFAYDPLSNGAIDYMHLAREVCGETVQDTAPEPEVLETTPPPAPETGEDQYRSYEGL